MTRESRRAWMLLAVVIVLGFWLAGCGGGGGDGGGGELTLEQRAEIEQTSQAITDSLAAATDPGSSSALDAAVRLAQGRSNVESADVIGGDVVVKYRDGGSEIWAQGNMLPSIPADMAEVRALTQSIAARALRPTEAVGNQRAVLINALSEDPGFAAITQIFSNIEAILDATGFEVLVLNGPNATPDRLRQLSDRSVIVYLGHGGVGRWSDPNYARWGWPYALQTGKPWDELYDPADWIANYIVRVNVDWGRGEEERERNWRSFYGVTGRFWEDAYSHSKFTNALFLNCACSGAKYEEFRQHLFDVGVAAYTGWTENQGVAPATAWRMLALMADGNNLQQAYDALPLGYRTQTSGGITSNLWIGPDAGRTMTLGGMRPSHPQVVIWAPQQNETITGRECTVRGMIEPWDSAMRATISVNGQSSRLPVETNGEFSQAVGLRSGTNVIRVSTIGLSEYASEVRVTGSFSSDVLYTTLWWNTNLSDIDLHLQPVDGANGSRSDCYFGNMRAIWGAELDVDDVNGFGPEHITARTLPTGKYKLWVHYYSTHGQTAPSVVNVAVSTNGGQSRIFTLPAMRNMDDVWDVCYISFPSGAIEVIDRYRPASSVYTLSARYMNDLPAKASELNGVGSDPSLRRYQPLLESTP